MCLRALCRRFKTGKYSGAVTPEEIPVLAERSFPLCMSDIYLHLRHEGHLKHGGRMQVFSP
jgi:hypothetical protein